MSDPISRLNAALPGRYEVERELGEGGMATVYLAEDLRHERKVALKVLKPELAAVVGAERFLAEIKTTANLQHPHILPLFDSGEADGFLFYVMPYVEGESLRDLLSREKQLQIDDAVRIAAEVADALDYAHRRSVIHRDIKPENVLLQDGRVVIADFGIALAVTAGGGARLTETGLSLGTPAYMSPEQATGDREVDGRSDIYALGCLLYEMLSGEPPHTGSTAQAILANVLTQRPRPLVELRETVPEWLDTVTERALARLPADRFPDAGAVRESLRRQRDVGRLGPTPPQLSAGSRVGWGQRVAWAGAGLMVGVVTVLGLSRGSSTSLAPTYLTLEVPEDITLRGDWMGTLTPAVTISPDGREVVFVGEQGGPRLYRVSLDDPDGVEPIAGTEGARVPFYSPSGSRIGFVLGNQIVSMPAGGGRVTAHADVVVSRGGAWDPTEEYIYFVPATFSGVSRVPVAGGPVETVTQPAFDGIDVAHMFPSVLPNGDLIYSSCCTDLSIYVLPDGDPNATPVRLLDGAYPRYVPGGYLMFRDGRSIRLAPYDVDAREVGEPFRVLDDVITATEGFAEFEISASGTLAYFGGASELERTLERVYPDGTVEPLGVPPAAHVFAIQHSPGGERIAYLPLSHAGNWEFYTYDLRRGGTPRPIMTDRATLLSPVWGPGESQVTFTWVRGGENAVYTLRLDSLGAEPQLLVGGEMAKWPLSWSEDGKWLLVGTDGGDGGQNVLIYSADADSVWAVLDQEYDEWNAYITRAGDWIVYDRNDSNRSEVYAMPFPNGEPCPISIGGGFSPRWSSDGRSVYYIKSDTLMVAEAFDRSICEARPRPVVAGVRSVWGLAPDDSYAITIAEEPRPQLKMILNWAQALEGGD